MFQLDNLEVSRATLVKSQHYSPPKYSRSYGRHVRDFYSNTCLLSGKTSNHEELEVHHLNSVKTHEKQKLVLYNGIVLTKKLHRKFHKFYGTECNLDQFLDFVFYSQTF